MFVSRRNVRKAGNPPEKYRETCSRVPKKCRIRDKECCFSEEVFKNFIESVQNCVSGFLSNVLFTSGVGVKQQMEVILFPA